MQKCLEGEAAPGVGPAPGCSAFLWSRAVGSSAPWALFSSQNKKGTGHLPPPQLAGQQTHFLLSGEMCGVLETIPEYI